MNTPLYGGAENLEFAAGRDPDTQIAAFLKPYQAGRKITVLTAYDYQMARLLAEGGVDCLLVGDSLGMVFQGHTSTHLVTVDHMVYHTAAVARGAGTLPVIADLPLGSYQSPDQARENSRELLAAGAGGVKFEGYIPGLTLSLVQAGIPVMGHLGLLPQSATEFKVQGKGEEGEKILQDALALEREGAFALVLECIPDGLAKKITQSLHIPTIGIGAGSGTSGQVLVINDLLGFSRGKKAKFVPDWPSLGDEVVQRVAQYCQEVRDVTYPGEKETYH